MVEETQKVYKLQDEIGDGFTAIYNVNDTYVEAGEADEEDKYYLMTFPMNSSLPQTAPAPKKQATLFEKIAARLATILAKKEEKVNVVLVDVDEDECVIVVA